MNLTEVMRIPFTDYDLGQTTIKEYLKELLLTVLWKGESFSGKRPFGNSGWEHFAGEALIIGKVLDGDITIYTDDEPYTEVDRRYTEEEYHAALEKIVDEIFKV